MEAGCGPTGELVQLTRPDPVQADDGRTTTKSYAEGDVLASIENVTGSRDGDVITGDGVPNVLKGGGGDDELVGGATDRTTPCTAAKAMTCWAETTGKPQGRQRTWMVTVI